MLSVILIAKYLTAVEQGFYYTFNSVLSLQIFVELGLTSIISQFAAHEKAHLDWRPDGTLDGVPINKARLKSIVLLSIKWYGVAAIVCILLLLPAGYMFFSSTPESHHFSHWKMPWIWLTVATALLLISNPLIAIYSGCGRVAETVANSVRQDASAYILFAIFLLLRMGLIAQCVMLSTKFLVGLLWLIKKRGFYIDLIRYHGADDKVSWKNEIWPLQWKIGISWLSRYFVFQLFTPIVFRYQGAVIAGQVGMSLSLVVAINAAAMSWVNTKIPRLNELVALKSYKALDSLFWKSSFPAVSLCALGCLFLCGIDLLGHYEHWKICSRIVAPTAMFFLATSIVINSFELIFSVYLRAHKQEPLLVNNIITGCLLALSSYLFGRYFGITQMFIGFLVISIVMTALALRIFVIKRQEWHEVVV
jgi:hypothetical protein